MELELYVLSQPVALSALKRPALVALAKQHSVKANGTNAQIIERLLEKGREMREELAAADTEGEVDLSTASEDNRLSVSSESESSIEGMDGRRQASSTGITSLGGAAEQQPVEPSSTDEVAAEKEDHQEAMMDLDLGASIRPVSPAPSFFALTPATLSPAKPQGPAFVFSGSPQPGTVAATSTHQQTTSTPAVPGAVPAPFEFTFSMPSLLSGISVGEASTSTSTSTGSEGAASMTAAQASVLAELRARTIPGSGSSLALGAISGAVGATGFGGDGGKGKKRAHPDQFDEAHERVFGQMGSIVDHYAAKRPRPAPAAAPMTTTSAGGQRQRATPAAQPRSLSATSARGPTSTTTGTGPRARIASATLASSSASTSTSALKSSLKSQKQVNALSELGWITSSAPAVKAKSSTDMASAAPSARGIRFDELGVLPRSGGGGVEGEKNGTATSAGSGSSLGKLGRKVLAAAAGGKQKKRRRSSMVVGRKPVLPPLNMSTSRPSALSASTTSTRVPMSLTTATGDNMKPLPSLPPLASSLSKRVAAPIQQQQPQGGFRSRLVGTFSSRAAVPAAATVTAEKAKEAKKEPGWKKFDLAKSLGTKRQAGSSKPNQPAATRQPSATATLPSSRIASTSGPSTSTATLQRSSSIRRPALADTRSRVGSIAVPTSTSQRSLAGLGTMGSRIPRSSSGRSLAPSAVAKGPVIGTDKEDEEEREEGELPEDLVEEIKQGNMGTIPSAAADAKEAEDEEMHEGSTVILGDEPAQEDPIATSDDNSVAGSSIISPLSLPPPQSTSAGLLATRLEMPEVEVPVKFDSPPPSVTVEQLAPVAPLVINKRSFVLAASTSSATSSREPLRSTSNSFSFSFAAPTATSAAKKVSKSPVKDRKKTGSSISRAVRDGGARAGLDPASVLGGGKAARAGGPSRHKV